jgi:hypothetical protein
MDLFEYIIDFCYSFVEAIEQMTDNMKGLMMDSDDVIKEL